FVTTKGTGQGTGLGLSLTMDIVQRHKGHINVESEVGEYTSITIQLPFDPANKDSDDGNNDDQTAA
ncbi:MAG: ATP-binding protein, partial [Gammaproteobacteria bacterium]|nr:ATP-binding protein [Gammaproteobacteria bacterium]